MNMMTTKVKLTTEVENTIAEINTLQVTINAWDIEHQKATLSLKTATDRLSKMR